MNHSFEAEALEDKKSERLELATLFIVAMLINPMRQGALDSFVDDGLTMADELLKRIG